MVCYIPRWYTRPKTVTHPGTNRARRALTSFMRRTPLTTMPRRQFTAEHGRLQQISIDSRHAAPAATIGPRQRSANQPHTAAAAADQRDRQTDRQTDGHPTVIHTLLRTPWFGSLAVLDPRVGNTMDVLSPFIPVLCHSD